MDAPSGPATTQPKASSVVPPGSVSATPIVPIDPARGVGPGVELSAGVDEHPT